MAGIGKPERKIRIEPEPGRKRAPHRPEPHRRKRNPVVTPKSPRVARVTPAGHQPPASTRDEA